MATKAAPTSRDRRREHSARSFPARTSGASRPYLLSAGAAADAARPRRQRRSPDRARPAAASALGLYAALALREVYYGHTPILWGVLWDAEADWLPVPRARHGARLLAGAASTRRASSAPASGASSRRSSSSRCSTLAFGVGTGHDFGTFGIFPTALVFTAVLDRALPRELRRRSAASAPRRSASAAARSLVGEGEHLDHLCARSAPRAAGSTTSSSASSAATRPTTSTCRGSATSPSCRGARRARRRRADRHRLGLSERELLEIVEEAHRRGVKVRVAPKTTELLIQRGEYVPGPGRAALRAAAAGLRRHRLGDQAHVRPRRQRRSSSSLGLPVWLAIAAAIKLTSRGPVFYRDRAHRARRARVPDVQVPDDVRRRRRAAGELERRTRPRARCSRSATTRGSRASALSCGGSRSTRCRTCSTSCAAR